MFEMRGGSEISRKDDKSHNSRAWPSPGFGVRGDEIRQGDLRVLLWSQSDVYGAYDAEK